MGIPSAGCFPGVACDLQGERSSGGVFCLCGCVDLLGDFPDPSAADLLIDGRVNSADAE